MTPQATHIRPATDADAPALLELIRIAMAVYAHRSGIGTLLDAQLETLDDLLEHLHADHVLVAEKEGGLVGTVRLVHRPGNDTAYFSRFAVLPSLHLNGVGSMLYQAAEDHLRECGVRFIRLHTALTNPLLVSFYRSRGFRLIETKTARGYPRGLFQKQIH
ncbi:MAG: GNAT family N-acetyltransferase [Saccharofermentanales bacterium]|jgi:predicted N-acetyltransferase YhbS|nr:GNAT family N-acetyltransferase [Clostridiaceae bacterium]